VHLKDSTLRHLRCLGLVLSLSYVLPVPVVVGLSQDQPPQVSNANGPTRQPDLVELIMLEPTLRLDIRYATANNLVGRPVYDEARAFLQSPAAEALVRAHQSLKKHGYGLTDLRRVPSMVGNKNLLGRYLSRETTVCCQSGTRFEAQSRLCS